MTCFSSGGNLTTSISDHFSQFSQLDIFDQIKGNKKVKFGRNWRTFNKNEFKDELSSSNWDDVSSPHIDTDTSVLNFYKKIEKLLDEMAPVKRLSKKEIGLQQRPWITPEILTTMYERDKLYSEFLDDKNPTSREEKHKIFKIKRNSVTTQLRKARKGYFNVYLKKTKTMLRKHGRVSETLSMYLRNRLLTLTNLLKTAKKLPILRKWLTSSTISI